MKRLKDLTKEELLTFIYNYPEISVDIYKEAAVCVCCSLEKGEYLYECEKCQEINSRDDSN